MTYVLTAAAHILKIEIFDEIQDFLTSIPDFFSVVSSYLPNNKFSRYLIFGACGWFLIETSPYILRHTSFFSYHYRSMEYFHRSSPQLSPVKVELFRELREDKVDLPKLHHDKLVILEINAGGGCNLTYYPNNSIIIATDVDEMYKELFMQNFEDNGLMSNLTLSHFTHTFPEELINIPDSSVSVVVGIHSLCQARSMKRALDEIKRVLLPGGRYYFIEHVKETSLASSLRQLRHLVTFAMVKCHVGRPTEELINNAGFSKVNLQRFRADLHELITPMRVLAPHIYGYCVK